MSWLIIIFVVIIFIMLIKNITGSGTESPNIMYTPGDMHMGLSSITRPYVLLVQEICTPFRGSKFVYTDPDTKKSIGPIEQLTGDPGDPLYTNHSDFSTGKVRLDTGERKGPFFDKEYIDKLEHEDEPYKLLREFSNRDERWYMTTTVLTSTPGDKSELRQIPLRATHIYEPPNDRPEVTPIKIYHLTTRWMTSGTLTVQVPRDAAGGETMETIKLRVLNIHLHGKRELNLQMQSQLLTHLRGHEYDIIGGDFNAKPTPELVAFLSEYVDVLDGKIGYPVQTADVDSEMYTDHLFVRKSLGAIELIASKVIEGAKTIIVDESGNLSSPNYIRQKIVIPGKFLSDHNLYIFKLQIRPGVHIYIATINILAPNNKATFALESTSRGRGKSPERLRDLEAWISEAIMS